MYIRVRVRIYELYVCVCVVCMYACLCAFAYVLNLYHTGIIIRILLLAGGYLSTWKEPADTVPTEQKANSVLLFIVAREDL